MATLVLMLVHDTNKQPGYTVPRKQTDVHVLTHADCTICTANTWLKVFHINRDEDAPYHHIGNSYVHALWYTYKYVYTLQ